MPPTRAWAGATLGLAFSEGGLTPLVFAARRGDVDLITLLLEMVIVLPVPSRPARSARTIVAVLSRWLLLEMVLAKYL